MPLSLSTSCDSQETCLKSSYPVTTMSNPKTWMEWLTSSLILLVWVEPRLCGWHLTPPQARSSCIFSAAGDTRTPLTWSQDLSFTQSDAPLSGKSCHSLIFIRLLRRFPTSPGFRQATFWARIITSRLPSGPYGWRERMHESMWPAASPLYSFTLCCVFAACPWVAVRLA